MKNKKEKLMIDLYQIGVLKFGSFVLKSGLTSPFYIDLRILISYPKILRNVAMVYKEILEQLSFDRMMAVPYTAIPIATAISLLNKKPLIYSRKEVKTYGIKRPVEGEYQKGERVVLIDDMITTGGSKLETIKLIENLGLKVKDVVVLFDRLQGGKEELKKEGYFLHSAFTIIDWLMVLKKNNKIDENKHQELLNYLARKQSR